MHTCCSLVINSNLHSEEAVHKVLCVKAKLVDEVVSLLYSEVCVFQVHSREVMDAKVYFAKTCFNSTMF